MKRFLCLILAMLFVAGSAFSATASDANEVVPQWEDYYLPQAEIAEIIDYKENNARATGLINGYGIGISKSGINILVIAAATDCISSVVKCGYKEIVVQRRANSSSSWAEYTRYEEVYRDSNCYDLTKSLAVPIGFQYRVTCIHYAKKNVLSVEKISNTSNIVTFPSS